MPKKKMGRPVKVLTEAEAIEAKAKLAKKVDKVEAKSAKAVVNPVVDPFNEAITEISAMLVKAPRALTLGKFMTAEGKHYYNFTDTTKSAISLREKVRKILTLMWGGGAYNYQQIADALRIETLDVQGLIDEQFIQREGVK